MPVAGTDMCPNAWTIAIENAALLNFLAAQLGLPKRQAQSDGEL